MDQLADDMVATLHALTRTLEAKELDAARLLARAGIYNQACEQLEKMRSAESGQQLSATLLLAKIYAQQGAYDQASTCWQQVLRSDAANREAISGLAAIARQRQNPPIWGVVRFMFGCLVALTLIIGFGIYMNHATQKLRSQITSFEADIREAVDEQARQLKETIALLAKASSEERSVSRDQWESLEQKLDMVHDLALTNGVGHGSTTAAAGSELYQSGDTQNQRPRASIPTLGTGLPQAGPIVWRKAEIDAIRCAYRLEAMVSALDKQLRAIEDMKIKPGGQSSFSNHATEKQ
jgi:tetratricopeptide (TPR) repeat protein